MRKKPAEELYFQILRRFIPFALPDYQALLGV